VRQWPQPRSSPLQPARSEIFSWRHLNDLNGVTVM
jgi:hypothetical protein